MKHCRCKHRIITVIMLSVGLVTSIVVCEMVLRALATNGHYVWRPGLQRTFKARPGVLPGIRGKKRFRINDSGLRGMPLDDGQELRILAIGGSTTEGLYLDDSETWPHLLQKLLTARLRKQVWVGNAGRSGHSSRQNMVQVQRLLRQYPNIDVIIVLAGINDFLQRLYNDTNYLPLAAFESLDSSSVQALVRQAFWVYPPQFQTALPFYKRSVLWERVRQAGFVLQQLARRQEMDGSNYQWWRHYRRQATTIRSALPDMSQALAEYSRNLTTIINLAREMGAKPVFVTQPTLWQADMPAGLDTLLWMGGVGDFMQSPGHQYYSAGALSSGMSRYNAVLKGVCTTNEVACIDLASALPKDTTVFYDDCHFNETGARRMAEMLAKTLLRNTQFHP